MCTPSLPPVSVWGGGGSDSKKWGLDRISVFRGGCWERGVTFSGGCVCSFSIKNKLKSEIFNNKKSVNKNVFVITKNRRIQTEILTKNLVTFKRWDGVKDEKF